MNILITGASKGIGAELVKQFATNPKNKIIAIARNNELLISLKQYCLENYNNSIEIIPMDFLAEDFTKEIGSAIEKYKFDIVINNAGYLLNKAFTEYTSQEIENLFKVNTYAPLQICQQVIANNNNHPCHIINIGSMGGYQGSVKFPGLSIYSASKAALANLTECLAEEYKETNIKINCLALGSVQTEMLNKAFPNYKAQLTPQQIAKYIVDFGMNGQQYFNGKILPISNTTP